MHWFGLAFAHLVFAGVLVFVGDVPMAEIQFCGALAVGAVAALYVMVVEKH